MVILIRQDNSTIKQSTVVNQGVGGGWLMGGGKELNTL
jgi:hypothetical protein